METTMRLKFLVILFVIILNISFVIEIDAQQQISLSEQIEQFSFDNLKKAVVDLRKTFPEEFDPENQFIKELENLQNEKSSVLILYSEAQQKEYLNRITNFKSKVLLANPLLDFERLLIVKRKAILRKGKSNENDIGFEAPHQCKSALKKTGWQNELVKLSPVSPNGDLQSIYHPSGDGYIGEIDLHWDGDKILFTRSDEESWKLFEIRPDGTGLRQVSQTPEDVDCMDGTYLPNGRIVFNSTANFKSIPCWHGKQLVANLYTANDDGSGMRQLCFDQAHTFHPSVLNNGQVIFNRWDYTGINHIYLRQLMIMNPDGTGQRAAYGSNSWFPNSLYFPKAIPQSNNRIVSILSGYHGTHKIGQLVVIDLSKGQHNADGMITRISGKGDSIDVKIKDQLVDSDWPKFADPFPLNDKYFLVSALMNEDGEFAIYLADVFDNLIELKRVPGYHLLEPVPLIQRQKPPVIVDKIDLTAETGNVYLQNVYHGPGLKGVVKGLIKKLRVFAYNYGYLGMAGPNKIGYGGPWDAMQIIGTTDVEKDGSAFFKVPANTPIAVQPIDEEGRAVQLMRSWFTVMPGENLSCVGCHENQSEVPMVKSTIAARTQPSELDNWYGPPRGFDFEREVQPVLDHYCIDCHNGSNEKIPDLRDESNFPDYKGKLSSTNEIKRLNENMLQATHGKLKYTPAYDELIKYIRRVGIEDDVEMLQPGEYFADNSELIQMLKKGHHGVQLNQEAWERFYTWIDLNAPCHGTWNDAFPIQDGVDYRRRELMAMYGGPKVDPEIVPELEKPKFPDIIGNKVKDKNHVNVENFPLSKEDAINQQKQYNKSEKIITLAKGLKLHLVKIPAGKFVMGDLNGLEDEYPLTEIEIEQPFWMGKFEITNEQFSLFNPTHDSKYYGKRHETEEDKGTPLDRPKQPVVRVSWKEAIEFCEWLSKETGMEFSLPTEAQWEYACRAGSGTSLNYGKVEDDFTAFANVGDLNFSLGKQIDGTRKVQVTGGVAHLDLEGAALSDKRFDDNGRVSVEVGSYHPNNWGLFDMHGNVAEWTKSSYKEYPYNDDDGRNEFSMTDNKVVRGGSFFDRPENCRSAFRSYHPAWMSVFDVGFRVVAKENPQISSN